MFCHKARVHVRYVAIIPQTNNRNESIDQNGNII